MFDVGMTDVLIAVALALGIAVLTSGWRWSNVNQRWHADAAGLDLESAVQRSLAAAPGRCLAARGEGRVTLTQWRRPMWTIVLAVLLFPLGLVFLLHKVPHTLTVLITSGGRGGSRIDLIGTTRTRTLDALTTALVVEHGADAEPLGVRL
jgi:hypothetical protein